MTHLSTATDHAAFVDRFDTFLFDCDGVLWSGTQAIGRAPDAVRLLVRRGKTVVFVSNNSTKSRREYLARFEALGIPADADHVFGSAYAAAEFVRTQRLPHLAGKPLYVIGMAGLREELADAGIPVISDPDDDAPVTSVADIGTITTRPATDVGAVLVGFDIAINYRKLAKAYTYIAGGAEFYATNDDATYPAAGRLFPGTGTVVAAVERSVGRRAVVLGKPHRTMLDVIVAKLDLNRSRTCMVGDRLDTDIQFGIHGGLSTALVLTGVSTLADVAASPIQPDYILPSLDAILAAESIPPPTGM